MMSRPLYHDADDCEAADEARIEGRQEREDERRAENAPRRFDTRVTRPVSSPSGERTDRKEPSP